MRMLITGLAIVGSLLGGIVAVVIIVASAMVWLPSLGVGALVVWWFVRPITEKERAWAFKKARAKRHVIDATSRLIRVKTIRITPPDSMADPGDPWNPSD